MIKVAPSVLSGDYAKLGESVALAEKWGGDYLHFDVMDGVFVPNITVGMPSLAAVRSYCSLPFDVHLMIINPEKYVERFVKAGADIITFHPEACADVKGTLLKIKELGKKCGLVVNPDKELSLVMPYVDLLDMVVFMGVFPGFGGQKFIPEVLDKIREFSKIVKEGGYNIELELDGGVNEDNAQTIKDAGINVLVAGSAVYNSINPIGTIKNLKR